MSDPKRTFAVLGHSLRHTMSPPIHKRLFALSGRQASDYIVRDIPEEALSREMASLRALDGFNVTIPHKIPIIPFLDSLDETAQRYQSVNTVKKENGRLRGYNTDVDGFLRTIDSMGASLESRVCLIGAGGVGRMFAIESLRQKAELTIAVRAENLPGAARLKEELLTLCPGSHVALTTCDALHGDFDLTINATPAGMFPRVDGMPVSAEALSGTKMLFDCIYNPTETRLLNTARQMGIPTAGGMTMLVWQAVAAHEIWDGDTYSLADIDALIARMVAQVDRDFPLPDGR